MLSWNEYIEELLSTPTVLDNMSLQYGDNTIAVSPIVKASIQMLESMIETEGRHNVFVFPEIKELLYEFVLSKVVFNVAAGKISITYDPHNFKLGQKLKYKKCVVLYDGCEIDAKDHRERIRIKFADTRFATNNVSLIPIEFAPIFQIASDKIKKITTQEVFEEHYSVAQAKEELKAIPSKQGIVDALFDYKTHLDGSVFVVTQKSNAKDYLGQTFINGIPLKDVLLIGEVQPDGNIGSCFSGQLSGNPAIVLASDLYSVIKAIEQGAKVQSIIINSSQNTVIDNQLDTLDDLSREEFPILCLTDTSNSFELDVLLDRGYNVWRWDANSLVETIHASNQKTTEKRIRNCSKQALTYERVNCIEITETLQLIYSHKTEIESQGTDVISAYNKLFSLLFTSLRIAVPFEREEICRAQSILDECKVALEHEKRFMSQELYRDLVKAITDFEKIFIISFDNPKVSKIAEIISSKKYSSVCIVISDRLDKMRCEAYWRNFAVRKHSPTVVKVLYPQEYASSDTVRYDATIIVGWLNNKNMRNVIYCYGTQEYIVLTYECEEKWRKAHTRTWSRLLSNSSNSRIVKNSFSRKARSEISDHRFTETTAVTHEETFDELTDIENLIQANRCRQYGISAGGQGQIVDAYPVSFVGGYLSFYRGGHKVITVTDIIINESESISLKTPDQLVVGDFVVVREADRDIIKDIADRILENSGKPNLRSVALRWKEALKVETMFSTTEDIFETLKLHGCTKGYQTVRNWIENEDQFSLKDKNDIICIAKALNDQMLLETVDSVYEAGQEVKGAHVQAGQYLSRLLKKQIVEALSSHEDIDAFNIWDPIELQLEDIGKVIILKIIDINRPIQIDSGNTNRLLSE